MGSRFLRRALVVGVLVLGAGISFVFTRGARPPVPEPEPQAASPPHTEIIGRSVEGRDIIAYTYGSGATRLVFVGGVHGGYEWNSVALAYRFMDYLEAEPAAIPAAVSVIVVPSLNPDGLFRVIGREGRFSPVDAPAEEDTSGKGRFNANGVDLNRNFDCMWKPTGTWRNTTVSGGISPFSEPESRALRDFILPKKPAAVIFWHSKSNAVYASECGGNILPATRGMMDAYARASGYAPATTFGAYAVSGDAGDWLSSVRIPAITVELATHTGVEWEQNLAGIKALFGYYGNQ